VEFRPGGLHDPAVKSQEDIHRAMHLEIVNAAYDVIGRRRDTPLSSYLTGAHIAKPKLNDQRNIVVSTAFVVPRY
jgi:hypothetical protein